MRNKIYCILGKFASGKTTIAKMLEEQYNYKRIVTCTTREKREGERHGIDYYFLRDDEFENLYNDNLLIAVNRIAVHKNIALSKAITDIEENNDILYYKKYGMDISKFDLNNHSYICVIEPSGYYELMNKLGKENVIGIYLKLADKERWLRALNRSTEPNLDEIAIKHFEEKKLYDNIEHDMDKIVENAGTPDNIVLQILDFINNL